MDRPPPERSPGALIQWLLGSRRPGPLGLVLAVALVSLVVRLALEQDLTVLLVSLALIPVASAAGVEPWTVSMALLTTSVAWFLPFQTSSYMVRALPPKTVSSRTSRPGASPSPTPA